MNTTKILAALDEELSRLRQVRQLLNGGVPEAPVKRRPGRPAKAAAVAPPAAPPVSKKRVLSEEARQRIAEAQKRRWAAQKRDAQ